jgi:hypothetical protein
MNINTYISNPPLPVSPGAALAVYQRKGSLPPHDKKSSLTIRAALRSFAQQRISIPWKRSSALHRRDHLWGAEHVIARFIFVGKDVEAHFDADLLQGPVLK